MTTFKDADIFGAPPQAQGSGLQLRDADIFSAPSQERQSNVRPTPIPIGAEGMGLAMREILANQPGWAKFLVGAKAMGLDLPAQRLKQLVTGREPQGADLADTLASREVLRTPSGAAGGVTGLLTGGLGARAALTAAGAGTPIGAGYLGASGIGATQGLLGDPVLEGESGVGRAITGGIFGAGGNLVGRALTGAPLFRQSEAVKNALERGIVPTPGQTLAASGSSLGARAGAMEEKLTGFPLVGDFIASSRDRAVQEGRRAAIHSASKVATTVDEAADEIGRGYETLYRGVKVSPDQPFRQGVLVARGSTTVPLNSEGLKEFNEIMKQKVFDRFKQPLDAAVVKKTIDADLGLVSSKLLKDPNTDKQAIGEAVRAAQGELRNLMNRSTLSQKGTPDVAAQMAELNRAFGNLSAVKKAAESAVGQDGAFTGLQLLKASRPGTETRDIGETMNTVLRNRIGNSFTADRAAAGGLLLGAPAAAGYMTGNPYLYALGATPLLYSRTGLRWMQGDLTPKALQALGPGLGLGSGLLARMNMERPGE